MAAAKGDVGMEEGGLPAMASVALAELRKVAGLEGAAILDLARSDSASVLLFDAATSVTNAIGGAHQMLRRCPHEASYGVGLDKRPIIVSPWVLHPDRRGGLVLWREPGARAWDEGDLVFVNTAASLIRVILEHGPGEATIDRLTGLPNRAYFMGEVNRYINRLEQDGRAGTLMLIDLNGLRHVNDSHGRAVGDDLLARAAKLLRSMVRPVDLVSRVGGDEFAIWLDTMDNLTATERAVSISERRLELPAPDKAPHPMHDVETFLKEMTFSIGLVSRQPGDGEDARNLLRRAHAALWEAKQTSGGAWAVSREVSVG